MVFFLPKTITRKRTVTSCAFCFSWACWKTNQREFAKCCVRALTHFWVEWAGMPQLLESGKAPGKSTTLTYGITLNGKLSLSIQPPTQYCCLGKWGFISTETLSLPHTQKTFNNQHSNTHLHTAVRCQRAWPMICENHATDKALVGWTSPQKIPISQYLFLIDIAVSQFYCGYKNPTQKQTRRLWGRGGQKSTCFWKKTHLVQFLVSLLY